MQVAKLTVIFIINKGFSEHHTKGWSVLWLKLQGIDPIFAPRPRLGIAFGEAWVGKADANLLSTRLRRK